MEGSSRQGDRYVVAGLSRLAVPVVRQLAEKGVVTVLARPDDEGTPYADMIGGDSVLLSFHESPVDALGDAVAEGPRCVLALADDDKENFNVAAECYRLDPTLPVVLRTIDSSFADEMELCEHMNIRRAYDMAALAAPSFVALALADERNGFDPITMRFGPEEVPLRKLVVERRSPLKGKTPDGVAAKLDCAVVAVKRDNVWEQGPPSAAPLAVGDEVVIGGRQIDVFSVARRNSTRFSHKNVVWIRRLGRGNRGRLLLAAIVLVGFMLAVSVLLGHALKLTALQMPYKAIVTAAGEELHDQAIPLQLLAVGSIVVWAILGGLLVTWVTDWAVEKRLGRRVDDFTDHAIVCGLSDVGYRVAKLLDTINVPTVVLAHAGERFVHELGWTVPVIDGNIRLADELRRAGVERASCVIAVTEDDMANLGACVHAERMKAEAADRDRGIRLPWPRRGPDEQAGEIRTVARLFDEKFYGRGKVASEFRVDQTLAAVEVAAAAFVDAATDEDAVRPFTIAGKDFLGLRYTVERDLTGSDIARWRAELGLVVLAARRNVGPVEGPSGARNGIGEGAKLIVVGPADAIRDLADPTRQAPTEEVPTRVLRTPADGRASYAM